MADAILARLRGGDAAGAERTIKAIELSAQPLNLFPQQAAQLALPPALTPPPVYTPQPPPQVTRPQLPPPPHAVTRTIHRPQSIQSSLAYFGDALTDQLLGYRSESLANSSALAKMANTARYKRSALIALSLLCMSASTALAAILPQMCGPDATEALQCFKTNLVPIAALCGVAGSLILASVKVDRSISSGHVSGLSTEWANLARDLHGALFLSPPSCDGSTPAAWVARIARTYDYVQGRTPHIDADAKKAALIVAQRSAMGRSLVTNV